MYGWIAVGTDVAKEVGVSYFQLCERPAIEVFVLAQYLIEKVKKVEREIKKKSK